MALATWWGVTGRNIRIQGVKSTCKSMFESVLNGFRLKEAPFNFLPLTHNGKVAKLTWLWVTDIKIQKLIFHRYCDRYHSLKVSRWSIIRCRYDEHLTFSDVRSRDVTGWPELEWPGSEIFTICAKKIYEQGWQKRRRSEPLYFRYLRKTREGCSNTPPGPAWVKDLPS